MTHSRKETEEQYELRVLQSVIKQLNKYAYRKEVADVLILIQDIIKFGGFKSDLREGHIDEREAYQHNIRSLRAQLLELYKKEGRKENVITDPLFYNATFSFLLLLAKYAPMNERDAEKNLLCPTSKQKITAQSRILFIGGCQYHPEHNPVNYSFWNKYDKERTENYLGARRNAIFKKISSAHEIPHPTDFDHSHSRSRTEPKKILQEAVDGGLLGLLIGAPLGGMGVPIASIYIPMAGPVIVGLMFGSWGAGFLIGALIGVGIVAGMPLLKNAYKKCFAKKPQVNINDAHEIFSYVKSNGVKSQPVAEMKRNSFEGAPPLYSSLLNATPTLVSSAKPKEGYVSINEKKSESFFASCCGFFRGRPRVSPAPKAAVTYQSLAPALRRRANTAPV